MKTKTSKQRLVLLIIALTAAEGYYGWLIFSGISAQSTAKFTVSQIKLPAHIGSTLPAAKAVITEQEYFKITRHLDLLDSLKHSDGGRHSYDSIVKSSPMLLDSLLAAHKMFLRQP